MFPAAVYERMIELRIATPQIVINACMYLEEHNHFEESFKTYERGIALFKWPNVYDIWNTYLMKFVHRYGGKKLERARDLFEQCLEHCPAQFAKSEFGFTIRSYNFPHLPRSVPNVCQVRRGARSCPSRHGDLQSGNARR
jgi:hypothetical protein